MLFDTTSQEHDWARVGELERLVQAPYISTKLRAGASISELWQEDWTHRLRQSRARQRGRGGPRGTGGVRARSLPCC